MTNKQVTFVVQFLKIDDKTIVTCLTIIIVTDGPVNTL